MRPHQKVIGSISHTVCFLLAFSLEIEIQFPEVQAATEAKGKQTATASDTPDQHNSQHANDGHDKNHDDGHSSDHHGDHGTASDSAHGHHAKKKKFALNTTPPLEFPSGCIAAKTANSCAVQTALSPLHWSFSGIDLHLAAASLLIQRSHTNFELGQGRLFLAASEQPAMIDAIFAKISVSQGKTLFNLNSKKQLVISSLSGAVIVTPLGRSAFLLPPGYEVRVGPVDNLGQAQLDVPLPIVLVPLFSDMLGIFNNNKTKVDTLLHGLKPIWQKSVKITAKLYEKEVFRQLAVEKERKKRLLELKRKRERANLEMRNLFRARNYY